MHPLPVMSTECLPLTSLWCIWEIVSCMYGERCNRSTVSTKPMSWLFRVVTNGFFRRGYGHIVFPALERLIPWGRGGGLCLRVSVDDSNHFVHVNRALRCVGTGIGASRHRC